MKKLVYPLDVFSLKNLNLGMLSGVKVDFNKTDYPYHVVLLDYGIAEFTPEEFTTALGILFSVDFDSLLHNKNYYFDAYRKKEKAFNDVLNASQGINALTVPVALTEFECAIRNEKRAYDLYYQRKCDFEDNYGCYACIDTYRLYEGIFETPREWI